MKATASFIIMLILINQICGQNEGDKWVIGYHSLGNPEYSIMHLDFSGSEMKIEWHFDENMLINETCANICDQIGEPILWTNGMQIFGKHGITVADSIVYNVSPEYWDWYNLEDDVPLGFPELDGAVILPIPDEPNLFSVLYHSAVLDLSEGFLINKLLESRVKMNQDSTFTTLFKDSMIGPVVNWYTGPILSCKHANGRDWWVVLFQSNSPNYFVYILDPTGIRFYKMDSVENSVPNGEGQATFSSLGNFVARMDASSAIGEQITLYSFDRCSGNLKLLETLHETLGFFTGVAFSPSERYLYADDNTHLWQWDLWSSDIPNSQKLVDTFDGFVQPGWFQMIFGPMKLAPDGRIYIIPATGSSEFIHVINQPDLEYDQCNFTQHSINLKVPNGRSAPNLPNYRLGPLDDSDCDTLGINNLPVSRWRKEQDIPGQQSPIRFTDLSYFNPETWLWDFDDDSTSSIPSPVHAFQPGLYHVCLTVSNEYASDSSCQWINILPTGLKEELDRTLPDIEIIPNPFKEYISITSRSEIFRTASLQLYDMHGRLIFDQPEITIPMKLYLPDFPPGVYLCNIRDADGSVRSMKLMKE